MMVKKCRICKIYAGQGAKMQDNPAKSRTVGMYIWQCVSLEIISAPVHAPPDKVI